MGTQPGHKERTEPAKDSVQRSLTPVVMQGSARVAFPRVFLSFIFSR